jgi:hypothetical protein
MARIQFPLSLEKLGLGLGLDPDFPTLLDDGRLVPAAQAVALGRPSQAMYQNAQTLVEYLRRRGAQSVDCVADYRASEDRPGGLMVRWGGEPSAHELAQLFAPIPCWLQLVPDDDYDERYRVSASVTGPAPFAPLGPRSRPSALAERGGVSTFA